MLISNFFVLLLNFKTKSTFIWLLIHAFDYLNLRLVGGISCCILIDALSFWYSHSVTTCQNSMKIKQSKINSASKLIPRFEAARDHFTTNVNVVWYEGWNSLELDSSEANFISSLVNHESAVAWEDAILTINNSHSYVRGCH